MKKSTATQRTGDLPPVRDDTRDAVVDSLGAAQALMSHDRPRALGALNEVFRAGAPPDASLSGSCIGSLVGLDIAPGLTQLSEMLTVTWLPWRGKTFDAVRARGDNVFARNSLILARLLWPLYAGYVAAGRDTYRAFTFRTYLAPGLTDPDRQVLKIDYDLAGNPGFTIRRVLDELVRVAPDFYLGKAHVKWWWGQWQMVAYFSLLRRDD